MRKTSHNKNIYFYLVSLISFFIGVTLIFLAYKMYFIEESDGYSYIVLGSVFLSISIMSIFVKIKLQKEKKNNEL